MSCFSTLADRAHPQISQLLRGSTFAASPLIGHRLGWELSALPNGLAMLCALTLVSLLLLPALVAFAYLVRRLGEIHVRRRSKTSPRRGETAAPLAVRSTLHCRGRRYDDLD